MKIYFTKHSFISPGFLANPNSEEYVHFTTAYATFYLYNSEKVTEIAKRFLNLSLVLQENMSFH